MSKTIKLAHETATSFSFDGVEYKPGKGGLFELPEEAQAAAFEHGFTAPKAKAAKGSKAEGADAEQPEQAEEQ